MKKNTKFFLLAVFCSPLIINGAYSAQCSKLNLTKCLDSACAINIGANPAARCQLCGTAGAGSAPTDNGIKQLSVGMSAKTTFSDKELKSAPSDPGARYSWATAECIKKIDGCTADDASENYDKLIEQSCKAAGIDSQMLSLNSAAKKIKNKNSCESEINLCLTGDKKCGSNFAKCESDDSFNNFFSACAVTAAGCDEYITDIRTGLFASRNTSIKSQDTLLANIVKSYQTARDNKLKSAKNTCADNAGKKSCIQTVCQNNMQNKCGVGFESEKSMATLLCGFYDTACSRLK